MYWYPNQFPEIRGKSIRERTKVLFPFYRRYQRIGLFYMLGVIMALAAVTTLMVNLPATNLYGIIAWIVGLLVWQIEYLVIVNKIEYPLLKQFLNNESYINIAWNTRLYIGYIPFSRHLACSAI